MLSNLNNIFINNQFSILYNDFFKINLLLYNRYLVYLLSILKYSKFVRYVPNQSDNNFFFFKQYHLFIINYYNFKFISNQLNIVQLDKSTMHICLIKI